MKKFRVWQKAHQKMLSWDQIKMSTLWDIFENPQYVVMQYIDRFDINKNEICEGDIFMSFGIPLIVKFREGIYIVEDQDCESIGWLSEIENKLIMGNIYEHKELLKNEKI